MKQKMLFQPYELKELIAAGRVIVIDIRDEERYREGHIPGAINAPEIFYYLGETSEEGLSEMNARLEELFSNAGIVPDKTVIFYEDELDSHFGSSFRGFRLLSYLGHVDAGVLDGGLAAWKAEGYTVDEAHVEPKKSDFTGTPQLDFIATRSDVLAAIDDPAVKLLDNRDREEWEGISSSPYGRDFAPRKGRLPGAVWIEWYEFMDRSHAVPAFKPAEEIRALCAEMGLFPNNDIIIYCFKGARASNTYVALKEAGFEHLRIYFGSWNEWSRDENLPIDEGLLDSDN